ncbi:hypothetical protein D9613_002029 [Agrocybe pediades]|uniref:Uncharacterized protein n=1 Tax=Agrocybe pediades TaxID=84607 RepID=A0A8H4R703_9AGAR|nr:hypothetical protein D9613_002029 [Agrocybe pediades]
MWCTRWFLPLLLLPLPTAPPFFLVLFLISLVVHAKPCFYCIILLTTLYFSSCYWQPFPIDSQLAVPWSENITTFADALNATLGQNYSQPLPSVMRAVDRCWCDFSSGSLFEPFNVSRWEYLSVQQVVADLLGKEEQKNSAVNETESPSLQANVTDEAELPSAQATTTKRSWWWIGSASSESPTETQLPEFQVALNIPQNDTSVGVPLNTTHIVATGETSAQPLLRKEYDLRQHDLGMIVDFRWS